MSRFWIMLWMLIYILPVHSQMTPQVQTIVEDISPANLRWLYDGLQLTFLDTGFTGRYVPIEMDDPNWYVYDVNEETLSRTNIWLAQPDIPATLSEAREQDSIAFLSPTGEYMAFISRDVGNLPTEPESFVYIYDYQNDTIIETPIPSDYGVTSVGLVEVLWSKSEAFVLGTTPREGGLAPVSNLYYLNFRTDEIYFWQIAVFEVEDRFWHIGGFLDISDDGNRVLLDAGDQLALWNVQNPDAVSFIPQTEVDAIHILDAQFTQSDGSEFIYFNDAGVGRYNINTETNELLTESLSAEDYREARFSPNIEGLALADDSAVYWLDLRDELP